MTNDTATPGGGEEAAARWLLDHGFTLLHRNWRQGHYELDIVAARKGTLHFIEVKTRRRDGLTRRNRHSTRTSAGHSSGPQMLI